MKTLVILILLSLSVVTTPFYPSPNCDTKILESLNHQNDAKAYLKLKKGKITKDSEGNSLITYYIKNVSNKSIRFKYSYCIVDWNKCIEKEKIFNLKPNSKTRVTQSSSSVTINIKWAEYLGIDW